MSNPSNEPNDPNDLHELRRQARLNELRLKIAQQNEALAALRRSGFRDSLEGFDDPSNYFDPRDYLFEVPRGLGGAIPSTRNDRDEGRDFPIFRTEQELAVIRGAARLVTSTNPIAVGILTTLTNYVIGNGFQYAVTPGADGESYFVNVANTVIREFLDENNWIGDLDRELFQRSRVDGEYFLGLWHVGNGHVQVRAVEPDQVTEPTNKSGLDKWIDFGPSPASSWTFGVHTDDTDAQAIHGYYVQWTNRDTEWDYFPGGNEPITPPNGAGMWMEHAKLNVVRAVKRGLSDFYPIQGNLDLARRVLRNMGEGSAVQAAIAWIQETAPGTTQAQTSSATLSRADVRYTTNAAQGSRTHTAQQYDPATILKVPSGQKYLPGPLGAQNAPSFITAAEALLRTVATRWSLPENLVTGTAENNNFASSLVAESPFVKFAESQQQFYARRDKRTLKRVLWFAWSAGRFGDVPWWLVEQSVEITVTPPQIEVRDPQKETQVRAMLHNAGILSRKTWSAQEGLDYDAEQKNLAAEAAAQGPAQSGSKPDDPSSAESLEGHLFNPLLHPRGGNPKNRGEFSRGAGPAGLGSRLKRIVAAARARKNATTPNASRPPATNPSSDAQNEPPPTTADKPKYILARGPAPPMRPGPARTGPSQQPASRFPAHEDPDRTDFDGLKEKNAAKDEERRKQIEFHDAVAEVTRWAVANGVPPEMVKKEIEKTISEPSVHAPGPGYVVAAVERLAQRQTGKSVEEMDKIYKDKKERAANDAFATATGSGGRKPPAPPPVATGGDGGGGDGDGENDDKAGKKRAKRTPIEPTVTKDSAGRITSSSATITEENIYGGTGTTPAARSQSKPDDAGHIIGRLLGGKGGATSDNVMAQLPAVNRGDFRMHEARIAEFVKDGNDVHVRVELVYPNAQTTRPSLIRYYTTVNGVTKVSKFPN